MGTRVRFKLEDAMEIAVQLHKAGELSEARSLYTDILRAVPGYPDALHFLGVVSHQLGDSEDAVARIKECLEVAPEHADAMNNLGNIYRETGFLEESEECYRKVLEFAPEHTDTLVNMGIVLRGLKKLEEAQEMLEKAIRINPKHARAYHNLGNVYRDQERFDEALTAYANSEKLEPLNPDSARAIAKLLYSSGRKDESIEVLNALLEMRPDDTGAKHQLASYSGESIPRRASDQYVREIFDVYAQRFDQSLARLKYQAPRLVAERVTAELGGRSEKYDILDIGCGTGLCGPLISDLAKSLIGVDLSKNMLNKAKKRNVYDRLVEAEICAYMDDAQDSADVIVCVDTFVYFGALREAFVSAARALRKGGSFFFTCEKHTREDHSNNYWLHPHGRYSHSTEYLRSALEAAGFQIRQIDDVVLRMERGEEVNGALVTAQLS